MAPFTAIGIRATLSSFYLFSSLLVFHHPPASIAVRHWAMQWIGISEQYWVITSEWLEILLPHPAAQHHPESSDNNISKRPQNRFRQQLYPFVRQLQFHLWIAWTLCSSLNKAHPNVPSSFAFFAAISYSATPRHPPSPSSFIASQVVYCPW